MNKHKALFADIFVSLVAKEFGSYTAHEAFISTVTKEYDPSYAFRTQMKLTKLNLHQILKTFEMKQFLKVSKVLNQGYINVKEIKTIADEPEEEGDCKSKCCGSSIVKEKKVNGSETI